MVLININMRWMRFVFDTNMADFFNNLMIYVCNILFAIVFVATIMWRAVIHVQILFNGPIAEFIKCYEATVIVINGSEVIPRICQCTNPLFQVIFCRNEFRDGNFTITTRVDSFECFKVFVPLLKCNQENSKFNFLNKLVLYGLHVLFLFLAFRLFLYIWVKILCKVKCFFNDLISFLVTLNARMIIEVIENSSSGFRK